MSVDLLTAEEYWMGRDKKYADSLTDEIRQNAAITIERWNALLQAYYADTGNEVHGCRSGWRPPSVNARVPGAAANSTHMLAQAADMEDPFKWLATWLVEERELVSSLGMWFEDPFSKREDGSLWTPDWVHGQIVPPKSGRRFYLPGPGVLVTR